MYRIFQKPLSIKNKDIFDKFKSEIKREQIKLLYQQIPIAIIGESLAAVFLGMALWHVINNTLVLIWLFYILVFSDLLKIPLLYFYHTKKELFSDKDWLNLIYAGIFISGVAWGIASSILIPTNSTPHQIYVVFMITGVTAAANVLYSPVQLAYLFFLFPSFGLFTLWLFLQGQIYVLLGICALIYIFVMLFVSYYFSQQLISTLAMRFKITNLSSVKMSLEEEVSTRTEELEKLLALTKSTLESTADGILVVNLKGNVEYFNQQFLDMWNIPPDFIKEHNDEEIINFVVNQVKDPDTFVNKIKELYNHDQESFDELHFKDGKIFERYSKPHWMYGQIVGRVWSFRDITLRVRLSYLANHDALTGLPNRTSLYERIEQTINYAQRTNCSLAVFFIDVDEFKLINDNLGHDAGDELLQKIALRLKKCVRESDTVARFGGDEFVLLFVTKSHKNTLLIAKKILDKISKPFKLTAQEVIVTSSIGISVYPKDGSDTTTLLKNADMAMYLAKRDGRNNFQFYNGAINEQSSRRLSMQTRIYNALKNQEFFILYQPIYDLKNMRLIGAEALLRWKQPDLGILMPDDFIPIAEETDLINQLGEWVFRHACFQNKTWQDMGLPPICMAINVSWKQLKKDNFIQIVQNAITDSGLSSEYLEIEFTESTVMKNSAKIDTVLQEISRMGIRMSIDDFGTGYSSLNSLRSFPVSKLKIDRGFVSGCTTNGNDASIVETIISLAHSLKLRVLAEGVDSTDKAFFLRQLHCDEVQGFLYSPPIEPQKMVELLKAPPSSKHNRRSLVARNQDFR